MNFSRFFQRESDKSAEIRLQAHEILAWAEHPYHQKFMRYLEEEAWKALDRSSPSDVTSSATRAKAIRDVRLHIERTIQSAMAIVEEEREDMEHGR